MSHAAATHELTNRIGSFRYLVTLSIVSLLVAACSPSTPPSTTQRETVTTMVPAREPDTTMGATTTTEAPPAPAEIAAEFPQSGAAAPIWDDEAYGTPAYAALLARLAEAGAPWVTVVPTWYQDASDSSSIYAETGGRTATDDSLIAAIEEAHALGLKVILKPHVDIAPGGSRITIEPASVEQWFSSYRDMILHYAAMAETHDVGQFVVGTELRGTSGQDAEWREVIAAVRDVYAGPITYAANHDEYTEVEFWDALDFIGVDAYFPLSDIPTTILSDLRRSWEPILESLDSLAEHFGRKVVFTEIGYPSQEGATVQPFNPSHSDVVSDEEQAAALQAMIDTVGGESWFGGFHWWMWFDEDDAAHAALSYMPEGKPAGAILEDYWASQ